MRRSSVKTLGVRIRERPVRESDSLLEIFTKELGTISALAPGIKKSRKRFPGSIRKFCIYRFDLSGTGRDTLFLKGASHVEGYEKIGLNLAKHCAADYILLLAGKFYPEGVRSMETFTSLREFLMCLEKVEDNEGPVRWMEIRILKDSGFMSDFNSCTDCGRALFGGKGPYFQVESGKTVCEKCPKEGKYILLNNNFINNVAMALEANCADYSLDASVSTDLYEKVISENIVKKLGFYPRSLASYRSIRRGER